MKNKVMYVDPVLEIITFNDLINDLKQLVEDSKQFEDIVYNILKDSMDKEDLSTLFNFSIINQLEWIISILEKQL